MQRAAAVAQGRNPQKFVALKMCPIAAAAKMGFPLEVEGHLSCSILVVPPPPRRGSAPSRRRRLASLILLHHYYSSLEAVVSQANYILEAKLYLYTGNTQYFCLRGPRQRRLLHGIGTVRPWYFQPRPKVLKLLLQCYELTEMKQ